MDFEVFPVVYPTLEWSADSGVVPALVGRNDLDGDGIDDLLVGNASDDTVATDAGSVHLFRGDGSTLLAAASASLWGATADERFGTSLLVVDDLDGDALPDVVVGAPGHGAGVGAVFIYGSVASAEPWATLQGNALDGSFGTSVDAGDFDGDGAADLAVGEPNGGSSEEGTVYVWLDIASVAGREADASWFGTEAGGHLGTVVISGGDADGDGDDEVVFSAPGLEGATSDAGGVFAIWGSNTGFSASADWTYRTSAYDFEAGAALSHGDFNGDGYEDLVVGTHFSLSAMLSVMDGGASGWATTPWAKFGGGDEYPQGELTLGRTADVNGDGLDDIPARATADFYHPCGCGVSGTSGWHVSDGTGRFASYYVGSIGDTTEPLGDIDGNGIGDLASGSGSVGIRLGLRDDDADGYFPEVLTRLADCDDNDDTIFPHAEEVDGDGVDSDCDGLDDTPPSTYVTTCPDISVPALAKLYADDFEGNWYPFSELVDQIEVAADSAPGSQVYTGSREPDSWCVSNYVEIQIADGAETIDESYSLQYFWDYDGDCESYTYSFAEKQYSFALQDPTGAVKGFEGWVRGSDSADSFEGHVQWADDTTAAVAFSYSEDAYDDGMSVLWQTNTSAGQLAECSLSVKAFAYTSQINSVDTLTTGTDELVVTTPASDACPPIIGDDYALAELASGSVSLVWAADWTPVSGEDQDGDGIPADFDCDDHEPRSHPCIYEDWSDTIDNNCDGISVQDSDDDGVDDDVDCDPDDPAVDADYTVFADYDHDGYGANNRSMSGCPGEDWVLISGDCDDEDAAANPGATEVCDGVDNDCDGRIDTNAVDRALVFPDMDADEYGSAESNGEARCAGHYRGWVETSGDCDDDNPAIYPGATEHVGDGIDGNCDGMEHPDYAGSVPDDPAKPCGCTTTPGSPAEGPAFAVLFGLVAWRTSRARPRRN